MTFLWNRKGTVLNDESNGVFRWFIIRKFRLRASGRHLGHPSKGSRLRWWSVFLWTLIFPVPNLIANLAAACCYPLLPKCGGQRNSSPFLCHDLWSLWMESKSRDAWLSLSGVSWLPGKHWSTMRPRGRSATSPTPGPQTGWWSGRPRRLHCAKRRRHSPRRRLHERQGMS